MVAGWFAAAVKVIYSVVSIVNTDRDAMKCPQLGHVVSAAFTFGGHSINPNLAGVSETVLKYEHQLVIDRLADMNNSFLSINGRIQENPEILLDLQHKIDKTEDETREILNEIQVLLDNTPEDNRKMMKGIIGTLNELISEMDRLLKPLESIISGNNFRKNTMKEIKQISHRMVKAMESQKENDIDSFKNAFDKFPPRETLMNFVYELEDTVSNPIVSAMKAHVLNSTLVFENYKKLFSNTVAQVLAMEGFYCGLAGISKNKSTDCHEKYSDNVDEAIGLFRTHVTTFKMDEKLYWPDRVAKLIDSSLDETDINVVADRIHGLLSGIYTTDVFSIFAWIHTENEQGDPNFFTTDGTPEGPQLLDQYKLCTEDESAKRWRYLVVMRSKTFHQVPPLLFDYERAAYRSYALTEQFVYEDHELKPRYDRSLPLVAYFRNRAKFYPSLPDLKESTEWTSVVRFPEGEKSRLEHSSAPRIQGFATFNATPVARFTNNGRPILREEDLKTRSSPRNYIGLGWF